jgi:two-component system, NtrC family, response regulator PilR
MSTYYHTLMQGVKKAIGTIAVTEASVEKRMLQLFMLLRVLMVVFFVGLYSGYFTGDRHQIDTNARILFLIVSLASFLQLVLLHMISSTRITGFFQLSLDIVLLTYVLSVTENSASFSFYLILIICASLVTSSFSAVLIAALSGICYALLLSGFFQEAVPLNSPPTGEILLSYAAFIGAALVSGFYARRREMLILSMKAQSHELESLTQKQMQLMNSMAEGVITLDLDSAITGINDAAKAILGLGSMSPEAIVGEKFDSALQHFGTAPSDVVSAINANGSCEMKVRRSDSEESVVKCTAMEIANASGGKNGKIVFISDVSKLKSIESRLEFHEKMTRLLSELESAGSDTLDEPSLLIGKSPQMHEIHAMIKKIAPAEAPVLLLGESGTGKEVVARSLHVYSHRKSKSFVPVNCGAIPDTLIESEFFGYVKGAFTGADRDTPGLFREADGGTLFLDEVGELPLHLQSKLLRVLQEQVVRPVGSAREIPVNVRIIAATNRDLKEAVDKGQFREDLYYRLRVVEIKIPPLRDRREDIPFLIAHFLDQVGYADRHSSSVSPQALSCLMSYSYPGNIRELENILSRCMVLGGGAILPEHLPEEVRVCVSGNVSGTASRSSYYPASEAALVDVPVDLEQLLSELEQRYILEALGKSGGVKKEAAKLLGLNFRSFRYRLKKYNIDSGDVA